jgi:hypothetical protein
VSIGPPAQATVAPGWYADPMTPGQARWWSGLDWTHHVQPLPAIARSAMAEESWGPVNLLVPRQRTMAVRALVWGIVAVVIDPLLAPSILAIVYGVIALGRSRQLTAQGQLPVGRRRAIAGIVLGAVGGAFTIFAVAVFLIRLQRL